MLHLVQDETVRRIFKRAPKIRRAYFNQTQRLIRIILEMLRETPFECMHNYRDILNKYASLTHMKQSDILHRLMTDFAESLDTIWVPDGDSQPGDAYASIMQLKNITIEFSALTQNRFVL